MSLDAQQLETPPRQPPSSRPLRVLVAPAGFKESLGPEAVASAMEEGLQRVLVDESTAMIVKLPLHDGGEGFCKALVAAHGGEIREMTVTGPVGEPVPSYFGLMMGEDGNKTAVLDSKFEEIFPGKIFQRVSYTEHLELTIPSKWPLPQVSV